jgi:hypothetical protein
MQKVYFIVVFHCQSMDFEFEIFQHKASEQEVKRIDRKKYETVEGKIL